MGAQAVAITGPEELEGALAGDGAPVVLAVRAPLERWVATAVAAVRAAGRPVRIRVEGADDGEQIGLVTLLLTLGVEPGEVDGVDPDRIARVAEVVARWERGGAGA